MNIKMQNSEKRSYQSKMTPFLVLIRYCS